MRELTLVIILVTVHALRELDLVNRRWTRRNMAFCAINRRMFAEQRIPGFRMVRYRKLRRLPTIHGVARFAFAPVRALRKLAAVRILMAIAAEPERDHLRKVATLMTGCAFHIYVLAQQWERCL